MFDTSPVVSIWLEMSINWHTKSQGPKKQDWKSVHFQICDREIKLILNVFIKVNQGVCSWFTRHICITEPTETQILNTF